MKDVIVIGAGAIGAFVARNLSRYQLDVLVIEKETDVGDVTSMANSAIVHSGYDPLPGTNKAKFNVAGNKMFPKLCQELDVNFGQVGTLTVALEDSQLPRLEALAERAEQNGVPTKILSAEEVIKMEPHINPDVKGALLCPTGGIVNPFTLVSHAFENAIDNGVQLHLSETVTGIESQDDGSFIVKTEKGHYEAKAVINCAGLHSDEIAAMVEPVAWKINPRKGEYYVLDHYAHGLVNHVLFPLPSEKGKGILVTMTTSFNYLCGPSSEFVDEKDDLATDSLTLADVKKSALEMVPGIPFGEQIRVFSGLRATPSTHDFIIEKAEKHPHFINVAGIESPGLASSPAIGEYVVDVLLGSVLPLKKNPHYNPKIKPYVHPLALSPTERDELVKKNPDYAVMVCNCEKVTLGELKDALHRSVPCLSVKALKKRTRAGFGKCQGGFCQARVLRLLADEQGLSPLQVLYDKKGSELVVGYSKDGGVKND